MTVLDIDVMVDVAPPYEDRIDVDLVTRAARAAVLAASRDEAAGLPANLHPENPADVDIRITDDREMQDLNSTFRGVDRPTDVLSFSFLDGPSEHDASLPPEMPVHLGDIAISYPYVERQAHELGHAADKELAWLTIHGMLQILGYSHDTDETARHMEGLEQIALESLAMSGD